MHLHRSFRREKTVTIIVMMILTVVMFCFSGTFFVLDAYAIGVGLLNPKKYPGTVVDLWGPVTTAQIIIQGTNVGFICVLYISQMTLSLDSSE
jgi:hypothetical protein